MNFETVSIQRFRVGIDFYYRTYTVREKKDGTIRIENNLNGATLFDNLNRSEIRVNGRPMNDIAALQAVVFNQKCNCKDEIDEMEHKIFDLTFDKTFE